MNFIKFLEYFFKKYLPNEGFCDRIIFVSGDGGMADALDSGSSGSNPVRVQVPFSAFCYALRILDFQGFFLISLLMKSFLR